MDLPWFCWQRSKVSIRQECWILCLIAAAFLACARFTSDLSCVVPSGQRSSQTKRLGMWVYCSVPCFLCPEGSATLTTLMRDKGEGSCCQSCFPKKLWRGSMAEPACRAAAPLPTVLQAALSFILTFTTMLVLSATPTPLCHQPGWGRCYA